MFSYGLETNFEDKFRLISNCQFLPQIQLHRVVLWVSQQLLEEEIQTHKLHVFTSQRGNYWKWMPEAMDPHLRTSISLVSIDTICFNVVRSVSAAPE